MFKLLRASLKQKIFLCTVGFYDFLRVQKIYVAAFLMLDFLFTPFSEGVFTFGVVFSTGAVMFFTLGLFLDFGLSASSGIVCGESTFGLPAFGVTALGVFGCEDSFFGVLIVSAFGVATFGVLATTGLAGVAASDLGVFTFGVAALDVLPFGLLADTLSDFGVSGLATCALSCTGVPNLAELLLLGDDFGVACLSIRAWEVLGLGEAFLPRDIG